MDEFVKSSSKGQAKSCCFFPSLLGLKGRKEKKLLLKSWRIFLMKTVDPLYCKTHDFLFAQNA
jgi:hypothetical protein